MAFAEQQALMRKEQEDGGAPVGFGESSTFGSAVAGYAIDQAFGEIWSCPGLDLKE